MDYKKLADLLFPDVKFTVEDLFKKFPPRPLGANCNVTRVAPSPTGYMHIGTIFQAFIDKLIALKSDGVFYVRLEDTDSKREVENAGQIANDMLNYFGLRAQEGYMGNNEPQIGNYGNYVQSKRLDYYKVFARRLVENGRGFPCFCEKATSKLDILKRREEQLESSEDIEQKDPCRDLTYEQIEENVKQGKPFAIRLKSIGDQDKTFKFTDLIKGEREIRENVKDVVVLKSDGMPPYGFAHAVDDTLMGTTVVVRGEEWFPSLSAHIEIFKALNLPLKKYAHTPVICKIDETNNKRKLSKRKDKEADARYFIEQGYPVTSVMEYLLNLINSDFEDWRKQNPTLPFLDFPFAVGKIGSNNPMFDFLKLNDVSKQVISKFSNQQVYDGVLTWAEVYQPELAQVLKSKKSFCLSLFNIDRQTQNPRKDIAKWSDVNELYSYMFLGLEEVKVATDYDFDPSVEREDIIAILKHYADVFSIKDDKTEWFAKIKNMCLPFGFSADMKEYRKTPEYFKGSIATMSGLIRVAITNRKNTPDLFEICLLLGQKEVLRRLNKAVEILSKN